MRQSHEHYEILLQEMFGLKHRLGRKQPQEPRLYKFSSFLELHVNALKSVSAMRADQLAQVFLPSGVVNFQGWRLHAPSGQPVSALLPAPLCVLRVERFGLCTDVF